MSSASNLQPLESPAEKVTADVQMSGAARDHSASIQPASPSESSLPVHVQAQTPVMSSQQQEGKERPTSPTTPSSDQMLDKSKQKLQQHKEFQGILLQLKSAISTLAASPDRDDVREALLAKLNEVHKAHLAVMSRAMNEARRRTSEDSEAEAHEAGQDDGNDEDGQELTRSEFACLPVYLVCLCSFIIGVRFLGWPHKRRRRRRKIPLMKNSAPFLLRSAARSGS